jgi:hypothetical protein
MANLGVANFESIERTGQRQADLLRLLERSGIGPRHYLGFRDCRIDHCGLERCAEVCSFGARIRQLAQVRGARKLLTQCEGPLFDLRIIRESWESPIGELNSVSIASAKQFHRRRLDMHCSSKVVAVGLFKTSIDRDGGRWVGEINVIIGGIAEEQLRQLFSVRRRRGHSKNIFSVRAVSDLTTALIQVFRPDLRSWCPPNSKLASGTPKQRERTEFYRWQLDLDPGERLIRYGADRYFNQLAKKARTIKPKKKRPYPHWLEHCMYGNHSIKCECRICIGRQ